MLQIIGWLLCVYLVVKGFELVAMKHVSAYVGASLAFLAAPAFFVLINEQSAATSAPFQQLGSDTGEYNAEIEAAVEADAAAIDRALDEAGRAVENGR